MGIAELIASLSASMGSSNRPSGADSSLSSLYKSGEIQRDSSSAALASALSASNGMGSAQRMNMMGFGMDLHGGVAQKPVLESRSLPGERSSSISRPDKFVDETIRKNKDKNFVQRIMRPREFPSLPLGNGYYGTHLMSWATLDDGTPIVYPNIVYDSQSKTLTLLSGRDAVIHALNTGEYIPFKTESEADLFSREYKRFWSESRKKKKRKTRR